MKKALVAGLLTFTFLVPVFAGTRPPVAKDQVKDADSLGTVYWLELKNGKQLLVSSDGRFVIENPKVRDLMKKTTITTLEDLRKNRMPDVNKFAFFYLYKAAQKPTALLVVDQYCPYCERFVKDLLQIMKQKEPKYSIAVTFFPIHPEAVDASCKMIAMKPDTARMAYIKMVKSSDDSLLRTVQCTRANREKFLKKALQLRFIAGVQGTPTIILPNGRKIVGYVNPESILF